MPTRLATFPEGYRHLGYLQTKIGFTVKDDLPGPARTGCRERSTPKARAWLAGSPTPGDCPSDSVDRIADA